MIEVPKPEVLRAAIDAIQANLHAWDQDYWLLSNRTHVPEENTCGTTACLAGWIAISDGLTVEQVAAMGDWVQEYALAALGFEEVPPGPCRCGSDCGRVSLRRSAEAEEFARIFWMTYDDDPAINHYRFTQEAFDAFKARITELTGVEL